MVWRKEREGKDRMGKIGWTGWMGWMRIRKDGIKWN